MDCLHLHKAAVTALHFIPVFISTSFHSQSKHILASASTDSSIQLIDVSLLSSSSLSLSSLPTSTLQGHEGEITCLTSSPDGTLLVSGGRDHTIRLWSLLANKCLRFVEDPGNANSKHKGSITSLHFRGDELISAGMDGCVKCFRVGATQSPRDEEACLSLDALLNWGAEDASEPRVEDKLEWSVTLLPSSGIAQCSFSAVMDRVLVSSDDREVAVFDASFAHCLLSLQSPNGGITSIRLDRQCHLLVGSDDHTILVYDTATDALLARLSQPTAVSAMAASGNWIVTPGEAYRLRVLNERGEESYSLVGHTGRVTSVAMNATTIVSCGYDVRVVCVRDG